MTDTPSVTDLRVQVLQQTSQLFSKWQGREDEQRAWWTGPVDGGPNGNGDYPVTDVTGVTTLRAGWLKLTSQIMKGDKGDNASSSFGFFFQNSVGSSERVRYVATSAQSFTKVAASAIHTSTSILTLTVEKNGVAVGTITFSPGVAKAVGTLTSGHLDLAADDYVDLVSPATVDATLGSVTVTFGN